MSQIKKVGDSGPVLIGPEISELLRDGVETTYTYEGTKAECESQRLVERAKGARSINLGPSDGGKWRLVATYAGSPEEDGGADVDPVQNTHELEVSPEQVPIWECAVLRDYLSYADIAIVRRAVNMFLSNSPLYSGSTLINNPTKADYITAMKVETTDDTDSEAVFNRAVAQGEFTTYFRSIYRRTITAASYSQVQAAFTGAGKIWTTAEITSFEGVPSGQWFGLPNVLWQKAPPRVSASSGGKTEIQYHYQEITQPSKYYYQAYNSATLLDA